ncbi:hypothetical protein PT300_15380 [Enterobacteriaceae bacterium ESL0689]|nr:hypothetical protein [Enterobacteriaceae bacterium ESL0689]
MGLVLFGCFKTEFIFVFESAMFEKISRMSRVLDLEMVNMMAHVTGGPHDGIVASSAASHHRHVGVMPQRSRERDRDDG